MTNFELQQLYEQNSCRADELEAKYRSGARLSRQECDEFRHCTQRIGLVARELWITQGKPDDPIFESLREPIKLSPLPESMRPLDLSHRQEGGVH